MLNVTLVGNNQLITRLSAMPENVRRSLRARITLLAIELRNKIINDKLSGQVLNVVSGALRRSIQWEISKDNAEAIQGRVFSSGDVKYAAIHEFGGQTAPHDIVPTKADALHFFAGGREVFAKIVHHPGSKMPERSFMRSSLNEMRPKIEAGMKEAILQGMMK